MCIGKLFLMVGSVRPRTAVFYRAEPEARALPL